MRRGCPGPADARRTSVRVRRTPPGTDVTSSSRPDHSRAKGLGLITPLPLRRSQGRSCVTVLKLCDELLRDEYPGSSKNWVFVTGADTDSSCSRRPDSSRAMRMTSGSILARLRRATLASTSSASIGLVGSNLRGGLGLREGGPRRKSPKMACLFIRLSRPRKNEPPLPPVLGVVVLALVLTLNVGDVGGDSVIGRGRSSSLLRIVESRRAAPGFDDFSIMEGNDGRRDDLWG
jgi:hypothetical protein